MYIMQEALCPPGFSYTSDASNDAREHAMTFTFAMCHFFPLPLP